MLAIIEWAKNFGKADALQFIRMDTWGDHPHLIAYYVESGFTHTGFSTPDPSPSLLKNYEGIELALFELEIN